MKAICFSLEDNDAPDVYHEDFMRRVIAKIDPDVSLQPGASF